VAATVVIIIIIIIIFLKKKGEKGEEEKRNGRLRVNSGEPGAGTTSNSGARLEARGCLLHAASSRPASQQPARRAGRCRFRLRFIIGARTFSAQQALQRGGLGILFPTFSSPPPPALPFLSLQYLWGQ